MEPDESTIGVESMVAARNKEPYVVLTWGERRAQLTPYEASQHALAILEAAVNAEQDAFLTDFMLTKVGTDEVRAAMMIKEFREWRQETGAARSRSDARQEKESEDAR
jgi:hypothetical protein